MKSKDSKSVQFGGHPEVSMMEENTEGCDRITVEWLSSSRSTGRYNMFRTFFSPVLQVCQCSTLGPR